MNFFRKFGDLIDSLDNEHHNETETPDPTEHPSIGARPPKDNFNVAIADCNAVHGKDCLSGQTCTAKECSINDGSAHGLSSPQPKSMALGITSPSWPASKVIRDRKTSIADESLVSTPDSRVSNDMSETEDGSEDTCCSCADLRKKLAARQAACVVRDSEAKRQVRQIETLEAALKAEKCRTRVAQGAAESAEKRAIILEREVGQNKVEIMDLKSRISLLELKLDLDYQEAEELTSDPIECESHDTHTKQAVMTVHLEQDQDEVRSSAGGVAASEIARLKATLRESQAMIEAVKAQQLRLTEGMDAELKLRDAELSMRDAEILALRGFDDIPNDCLGRDVAPIREITFVEPGTLGIEFEEMEAPFYVQEVIFGTQAEGRVRSGDHIIDINGIRADSMTWSELVGLMKPRPVTVHVQHVSQRAKKPMFEKQAEALEKGVEAAWGTVCLLTGRAKNITAKAVTSALTELKDLAKESQAQSIEHKDLLPVAV